MANTLYYGVSTTKSNERTKVVELVNVVDFDEESLKAGDLLVVHFSNGNTCGKPHLCLMLRDNQVNNSTSTDEGKPIKYRGNVLSYPEIWRDSETVAFSYTQVNTVPKSFYWEILDDGKATNINYGLVKIDDPEDSNSAISYGALVELFSDNKSGYGLTYNRAEESYTLVAGNLALTKSGEPIGSSIPIFIPPIPTKLSELENDEGFITNHPEENIYFSPGHGIGIREDNTDLSPLVFIPKDTGSEHNTYLQAPNNLILRGAASKLVVLGSEGYSSNVKVRGNLEVVANTSGGAAGNLTVAGASTLSGSLTVSGLSTFNGSATFASGQTVTLGGTTNATGTLSIADSNLYIKHTKNGQTTSLRLNPHILYFLDDTNFLSIDRCYSKNLRYPANSAYPSINPNNDSRADSQRTIKDGNSKSVLLVEIPEKANYKIIAVVGFNVNDVTGNTDVATKMNIMQVRKYVDNNKSYVRCQMRNLHTSENNVYMEFQILYQKITI